MMQESGSKGNDPMQASECGYNEKYPKKKDGITDSEYSIYAGIHYLSDYIKKAEVENPTDIEHILLALQGYNYEQAYILWYKLQVDVYGVPKYVPHVLRYYHLENGNIVEIAKSKVCNRRKAILELVWI